jgi:hypothetical protein
MKKLSDFSNTARLRTYVSLALGAGAHSMAEHNAHAGIITSPVNETSVNRLDEIFITFSNGVISSGRGTGDVHPGVDLGTLTGVSGGPIGKLRRNLPAIVSDTVNSNPATWSFVSLQPLAYGTTIDANTQWGGEQSGGEGGGLVRIDRGLSNAYYGLKFYAGEGTYNYGWMEVSTPTPGYDLTFGTAAVETIANTSIGAGVVAVPEPSTVALLAMAGGAAALRLLRKKKAA